MNKFFNSIQSNGGVNTTSNIPLTNALFLDNNMTTKMYSTTSNKKELPERIFIKRNSLLTDMFHISHIRTIRHIFVSIMLVLALQKFFSDLMENGE